MAEGVLLRPDQLTSQGEPGGLVRSQEQKKGKSKIVKKEEVDLEAPGNVEADTTSGTEAEGKWNTATTLVALFKLLYIPLGLLTLLLLATNFYLNFPFPLAVTLASIVGLQQSGCLNSYSGFSFKPANYCNLLGLEVNGLVAFQVHISNICP